MTKKELQTKFPNLTYYGSWAKIPSHLTTKSMLVSKLKWKEGIEPVAVKGNTLSKPGYYFLYNINDFAHG